MGTLQPPIDGHSSEYSPFTWHDDPVWDNDLHWDTDLQWDDELLCYVEVAIEDLPMLETLLEQDFTVEEAANLIHLREQVYEIPEMVDRLASNAALGFARWRYQQGLLSDHFPGQEQKAHTLLTIEALLAFAS